MPVRTFWLLHKNVDRLMAETDLRLVNVMASVHSGEAITTLVTSLQKQLGKVADIDEGRQAIASAKLDREGLKALRGLGKAPQ